MLEVLDSLYHSLSLSSLFHSHLSISPILRDIQLTKRVGRAIVLLAMAKDLTHKRCEVQEDALLHGAELVNHLWEMMARKKRGGGLG